MPMIKFSFRYNLVFPIMQSLCTLIRKIVCIIMIKVIKFNNSFILAFSMFFSEFIFGLVLYQYHINFLSKNIRGKFMGLKLIESSRRLKTNDQGGIIFLLIVSISFLDFIQFLLSSYYLQEFSNKYNRSKSLDIRLRSVLIISSALFCGYILKLPILKHQQVSLIIIFICLLTTIITEYYFNNFSRDEIIINYHLYLFIIIAIHFFNSFKDMIEKYIFEYNYLNPFFVLIFEGMFGDLFTLSFQLLFRSNKIFINIFSDSLNNNILLIIFLLFYFLSSGGLNIYRVTTNKIYSPMTKALSDVLFDTGFIIYYFFSEQDFLDKNKKKNHLHFIINLILSLITLFFGCVYNEIIILFCCNLEYNTYSEISSRGIPIEPDIDLNDSFEE